MSDYESLIEIRVKIQRNIIQTEKNAPGHNNRNCNGPRLAPERKKANGLHRAMKIRPVHGFSCHYGI